VCFLDAVQLTRMQLARWTRPQRYLKALLDVYRIRTRSTVERLTSKASAMASSLRRGPATPSAAFSRTRACVSVRAAAFPFDTNPVNCARFLGRQLHPVQLHPPVLYRTLSSSLQCCCHDGPLSTTIGMATGGVIDSRPMVY
jgi:hypothetical protein